MDWAHFLVEGIHDIITHVRFGDRDDRLKDLGLVQLFPVVFAARPYNTLTVSHYLTSYLSPKKFTEIRPQFSE